MHSASKLVPAIRVMLICAALGGCGSLAVSGEDEFNDPYEPFNRKVFALNETLDRNIVKPVAKAYRDALPQYARDRIRAVIDNLGEPLIFVNNVLQLRLDAASATLGRFVINSIAGFGGMFDRATEDGLPRQTGDFGQTLYRWGVSDGPYLVLPFFGPSNIRDTFGLGVDFFSSPLTFAFPEGDRWAYAITKGIVDGIDKRERTIEALDILEQSALDFYVHLRSVWRQYRAGILSQARKDEKSDELVDPESPAR